MATALGSGSRRGLRPPARWSVGTIAFSALQLLSTVVRLATISSVDLVAFAAGFAIVMAATLAAAYQPARNAARVDPAQTPRLDP